MTLEGSNPSVAGRRLGDFTIQCELGRGGMGVVYRARQESMGRIVALKTLPSFVGMDHDAVARFRREAEAAGRLSHPGIVPIFAVGEAEGVHYYAMELIEGPSLSSLIESLADREPERLLGTLAEECEGFQETANRSMSLSGSRYAYSCAAIVADLASALTTAHRGMVIHRDIKPSNVLIRETGTPVLVDFGLARDEMSVGLTQSGDALGTPAYMAPEQARGEKDLDARVDIYGLGALLYEMLTLRPPFDGAHPGEIMRKIVDTDPIPVRQLNPRVPPDLEKIVHTCLAKQADDRYAAAEALEMDLRAFLDGREVVARKPRIIDRVRRVLRRDRRAVAVGAAVLFVSAVAFGVVGLVADRRSEREGTAALADALRFGRAGDVQAQQEAYGRALALLDPSAVAVAREEHLPIVFEALYAKREFDVLRDLLDSWPNGQRDAVWSQIDRRLRGIGSLSVEAPSSATVELRRVGESLGPWKSFENGTSLPIGDVLVRVAAPGEADVVHRVTIERDREAKL
ncbi:MAG: serine/threonine protein kinase, partial [Planctomycetes bacterium]|nr:serine/threonine protein kinase [Planctomycetota bacterium]